MRSSAQWGNCLCCNFLFNVCTRDLDTHSFVFNFLSRNPVNESFFSLPYLLFYIFSHRNLNHRHGPHSQCHKIRTDWIVVVVVVAWWYCYIEVSPVNRYYSVSHSLGQYFIFLIYLFLFLFGFFFMCLFNLLSL